MIDLEKRIVQAADIVTVALDELLPRADGPESRLTEAMRYAALGPGNQARDLFLEHGAGGVTMRGVAARIGVTPMALYRHFDNRDALLTATTPAGPSPSRAPAATASSIGGRPRDATVTW